MAVIKERGISSIGEEVLATLFPAIGAIGLFIIHGPCSKGVWLWLYRGSVCGAGSERLDYLYQWLLRV